MAEKKTETESTPQNTGDAAKPKGGKKITKMEAVRRSLKKLGKAATPTAIQADVRQRFGVEMSTDHISTYKGDIARKARQQREAKTLAANKPREAPQERPARTTAAGNGRKPAAVELADVMAVRSLVDRVGAEHLRTLIAAFER